MWKSKRTNPYNIDSPNRTLFCMGPSLLLKMVSTSVQFQLIKSLSISLQYYIYFWPLCSPEQTTFFISSSSSFKWLVSIIKTELCHSLHITWKEYGCGKKQDQESHKIKHDKREGYAGIPRTAEQRRKTWIIPSSKEASHNRHLGTNREQH